MFEELKKLVASWIPTKRVTILNNLHDSRSRGPGLDVDALHSALRQAEGGDVRELFAIYRDVILSDAHIQSEFSKRKLAVIGDTSLILPGDKRNKDDVAAATLVDAMIMGVPGWLRAVGHLLDSVLWPVAVVEKVFRPTATGYVLAELVPVPHELLDFNGGILKIRETDLAGNPTNVAHPPDPRRYIIHRSHLLTTPDHWGGPMRSILFWWLFGAMDRDWWARFLDRFGSPFLVGKYEQSDDQSRWMLEKAFSAAVKIGGLVISKDTQVELQQASQQSAGDAFEKFFTISRREISKLIVGQTLSAEAQSTGLGSGVANAQAGVRDDYRQFDSKVMGETLRDQLFRQYVLINSIPGQVPTIAWGSVSIGESEVTGALLSSLSTAGLRVTDEGLESLSEKLGLQIERVPGPAAAPKLDEMTTFSAWVPSRLERADAALEEISRRGAAPLAQAFRGSLSPVRQMVLDSTSPEDLQSRILKSYSDWPAGRVAEVIEQALVAFAANGVAR